MASPYNDPPSPLPLGPQSNYPPSTSQHQQVHYQQQAPLQQTQSRTAKPPRSRGLSVHSDKSGGSNKKDPAETHNEKERQRLHSKADPTMAMNEAEPSAIAAQSKNNLQSLRLLEHKDHTGNVITDPDLSNPTRWREERPLATILAFEAAIDGNYRNSMVNTGDTESVMSGAWNQRSSYYASGNTSRLHHESYYGSRPPSSFRLDNNPSRNGHFDQQQGQYGSSQDRRRVPRMAPDPQYRARQTGANVYAAGNNQRSYETVASGSGSSAEQAGYQTDPTSSDNSSIGHQSPLRQTNDYGIGFSQPAEYQPSAFSVAGGAPQNGISNGGAPPAVPRKEGGAILRKAPTQESQAKTESGDKRKSWFKRLSKGKQSS